MVRSFKLVGFLCQISVPRPYLRAIGTVKSVYMLVSCPSTLLLGGGIHVAAGGACLGIPFRILSALQRTQAVNWLACNQSEG